VLARGERLVLIEIEKVLTSEKPDAVLVYGDTNSTLAGALSAAKLHIPIAHVEAGLRSFNRMMPEEINRVVTDHLSTTLFAPSRKAVLQLAHEGIEDGVHLVGDIMLDALLANAAVARRRSRIVEQLQIREKAYYVCTIHRAENTDDETTLRKIFQGLATLDRPVVVPLHPRTKQMIERCSILLTGPVKVIEPLGYLDMLELQRSAAVVLTDSGGVQKEAYYLGVPCLTLRNETEWVETIESGWNVLWRADAPSSIRELVLRQASFDGPRPPLYGEGNAAATIADILTRSLS